MRDRRDVLDVLEIAQHRPRFLRATFAKEPARTFEKLLGVIEGLVAITEQLSGGGQNAPRSLAQEVPIQRALQTSRQNLPPRHIPTLNKAPKTSRKVTFRHLFIIRSNSECIVLTVVAALPFSTRKRLSARSITPSLFNWPACGLGP